MNHFLDVAVLAVDCVVELLHVLIGDFVGKFVERRSDVGMLLQRLPANHGYCFIGWKIVAIILEHEKIERRNQAVCSVPGN